LGGDGGEEKEEEEELSNSDYKNTKMNESVQI
jgi:hypothetical protein